MAVNAGAQEGAAVTMQVADGVGEEEDSAGRIEAARLAMASLLGTSGAGRRHESFRPVVTYMCRQFSSRGVLNELDILRYILNNYNVTLRVTTFQVGMS